MDEVSKDFGGFTVTSSRIPDYPKPDIATISATKGIAKDLVARHRCSIRYPIKCALLIDFGID